MTGNAIRLYVGKRNVQRSMRVLMTTATAIKFEVGLLRCKMASVARLECLSGCRRVPQMAANARHSPVFSSGCFYLTRCCGMALCTTLFFRGFCLSRRRAGTKREQGNPYGQHQHNHQTITISCSHLSTFVNKAKYLETKIIKIMPQSPKTVNGATAWRFANSVF